MASAGARAYNAGLGADSSAWSRAEPLVGVKGASPPEAESLFKTVSKFVFKFFNVK